MVGRACGGNWLEGYWGTEVPCVRCVGVYVYNIGWFNFDRYKSGKAHTNA